ncbi:cytochrome c nitrite reductase small subunit [Desulfotalea psychrophila]|uniref:Probable small subunit of cytochrome c nitrite reductase n=1 Tax=Desulfotalea psychrophila (strain LSv54 / DSM 12343) TaxID=177439 RepID=Q6ARF2_DESPS|nr:cytochrome c nitrite reductase small subunit [Desulfotalea psychrophila]CAG35072.1 probable small subunit of cytochrome c nitrite reductase [Desulfotalea psychrophila LSv54]
MKSGKFIAYSAIIALFTAVVLFFYLLDTSKALSYLSTDPKACINCHVMNAQYASWQHSSHANQAGCIDCHLPTDSFVHKYISKARDGWNHSVAFTLNTYAPRIEISADGARRVQANCISCHNRLTGTIRANEDKYHDFSKAKATERKCWDCHRNVPHGGVHSIISAPNNLGVRELQ